MGCKNTASKSQSPPDIAQVFRKFYSYHGKDATAIKVANDIMNCRTEVLGGHLLECDSCGESHYCFNSCRNRHCPQCQFLAKAKWVEARLEELLPVQYFHVVFTIASELNGIFLLNKKICYNLLFKAVSETLKEVATKRLNAEIGFSAILHNWGQQLLDHPHIHVVVPGGGFSITEDKWISCRKDYFLPIKVLSTVFRGKLLSMLEKEKLEIPEGESLKSILTRASKHDWVVYAKAPFNGPESVISYLGQYTHKVAISNNRIKEIKDDSVVFSYRDRADNNEIKLLELDGKEFVRRFLLHTLPSKFCRIRHYGFLSRRAKKKKLQKARELLKAKLIEKIKDETWKELLKRLTGIDIDLCPKCKIGKMIKTKTIPMSLKPKKIKDTS